VSGQLAVSGDLPSDTTSALAQLRDWESQGITDVFDMRGEADDSDFIHANSDRITSHWFGVDDNGTRRSDDWFESFVSHARVILRDPARKILVHCHMGVNRGPSALYAIMIDQGWDEIGALRDIRNARPIAGIIYAPDVIDWFTRGIGFGSNEVREARGRVEAWLDRNELDLHWVIRCIGNRLAN
jgi:hypothetical protein